MANGRVSCASRIVESRRDADGTTMRTAGTSQIDFALKAAHFSRTNSACDCDELPGASNPELHSQPRGFLELRDFGMSG